MTDQRPTTDQLDLFRQPAELPPLDPAEPLEGDVVRVPLARRTQMTELAGETWEDAFGGAA